jgi:hypothetical protein
MHVSCIIFDLNAQNKRNDWFFLTEISSCLKIYSYKSIACLLFGEVGLFDATSGGIFLFGDGIWIRRSRMGNSSVA